MTTDTKSEPMPDASVAELDEMLSSLEAIARGQRDSSVPEGTYLGTEDLEGAPARFFKQKSMVNFNGKPLPERVPYWHNGTNSWVMLATAMLPQLLAERMNDGNVTFTRQPPPGYVAPEPDMSIQCPIEQNGRRTCMGIGNGNGFYSVDAFEKHMRALHTEEYAAILRKEERTERREELDRQNALADAMLAIARGGTALPPAVPPAAGVSYYACRVEPCPRFFDTAAGRTLHEQKAHK